MSRRNEYTGETCENGHAMTFRVVRIGAGPESRRGPTCWHAECSQHRQWQIGASVAGCDETGMEPAQP
jgi:hypothetical protein